MKNKKLQNRSLNRHSKTASLLIEVIHDLSKAHRFVRGPAKSLLYDEDDLARIMWSQEHRRVREQLKRMKKQRLLKYKMVGVKYQIALTQAGLIEAFRERVLSADLFDDDRVCMVVFDIPETQRRIRRLLREFLSRAAFIPIQRSVWISPFDAGEQLMELFQLTGATKWVQVFVACRQVVKVRK